MTQEMTVVMVVGHYWHGSTWWKLGRFHRGILHVLHSNQCLINNNAPDIFVPDYSGMTILSPLAFRVNKLTRAGLFEPRLS